MYHELQVTLINEAGDKRLTRSERTVEMRSTPLAHRICKMTERATNESPEHGKYGPWKILAWNWQS
jgi:hypothetical protein